MFSRFYGIKTDVFLKIFDHKRPLTQKISDYLIKGTKLGTNWYNFIYKTFDSGSAGLNGALGRSISPRFRP